MAKYCYIFKGPTNVNDANISEKIIRETSAINEQKNKYHKIRISKNEDAGVSQPPLFRNPCTALFHDYYFSRILFKGRLFCNKATKVYYL